MNTNIQKTGQIMLRKVIRQQGIICILIGILIVLIKVYIGIHYNPTDDGLRALLSLLETIGIALTGFGLFGIILDSRNWREYFAIRLREIVIEQDYLIETRIIG